MPRKSFKEKNYSSKHKHGNEKSHSKHSRKHNKCDLCFCVDIGIKNIQKWNELKNQCAYKSDAEFANYILTLVENHVGSISNNNGKINSKINSESSENESNTLSTIENSSEYQHNQHVRHHKKDKKSSYHHQSKNHHHRKKHDSHKSEKRSSKHNVHFEVVSSPEINNECDTKNTKSECVNYTETIPIAHRFDLQKSSNSVNVSTAEETISKSPKKEIVDEKETSVEVCRIDQSERTEDDQNCTNSPCINISDIEPVPNLLIDKLDFNDINLKKIITDVNSNNENLCANLTPTTVVSKQIIETELDRYCENNQLKVSKKDRFNESVNKHKSKRHLDREKSSLDIKVKHKRKIEKYSDDDKKKLKSHDVRKAPQLEFMASAMATGQIENIDVENEIDTSPDEEEQKNDRVAIRIKLCYCCNTRHIQEGCPLKNPIEIIDDSVSLSSWNEKQKLSYNVNNTRNRDEDDEVSYAFASLPSMCCLRELDEKHGPSIFAKEDIKKYTQFGPLIGKTVKEVDIPDDFDMRHIWEIYTEDRHIYINTEDTATSNWIRFLRPAETREKRTLSAVIKNGDLYLITCQQIAPGEELRYWLDDQIQTNKRKIEKTNCGGCNLVFQHALYYRTHCSIFHDARYSLTIRKYHCKVCGQAVLGKDNIVRHAAELHNGQGAYQCQFCKKFFLRLNYLEMHRSYGCAANPHRSRPLCDFCGRKFCQPQKLKVHIKRMHSDISLSEFQCPLCLKLLGSRAAVQRHAREVHRGMGLTKNTTSHGPTGSSLSCIRCGKLFQNKSNLKIHMLTHSGVKPFRCKQDNCNAAFTTKQCLQFHYKKVHGFTEDFMPTIERSVEYTFEAYSGGVTTDDDVAQISVEPVEYFNNTQAIISKKKAVSKVSELSSDVGDKFKEEKDKVINNSSVLYSPALINSEQSSGSTQTPPILESCIAQNKTQPIASKGSKKWLGSSDQQEIYSFDEDHRDETSNVILDVDEPRQDNDRSKFNLCLSVYNARHDSSNASLLVEAALDSVSDIHVGTESNQNCTDSLVVSNLYPLSQHDNLSDMNYGQTELASERDINLISPSVDHVSVTDHENPNIDYNALPHDDFSTPNSPSLPNHLIHEYVTQRSSSVRPRNDYEINRSDHSPRDSPHYDFNQTLNADTISNDSDGVVAQNLSINAKDKDRLELDFSCYKTHYDDVDSTDLSMRKYDSLRNKFDVESDDRNYDIPIDVTDDRKGYNSSSSELHKQFTTDNAPNVENYSDVIDASDVKSVDNDLRTKSYDGLDSDALRSLKYDLESKYENELRTKGYESMEADDLRSKIYESNLDADLRANKLYNILDNPELRNKTYDALLETDFRTDRGFEPLILNPTELQGLDMSARSGYHGFHTGSSVSRYHHVYGEPERETVPYGPPTDVLRVVSLDLTSQTRHGLHGLHAQIPNARLLTEHSLQHNLTANRLLTDHNRLTLDQTRLISTEHNLSVALLGSEGRLLSDHTTNRILSNEQITEPRLVSPDAHRIMSETSRLSNRSFSSYAMSTSYHPPAIGSRSHIGSPSHNPSYHHYSGYY